jgi:hypothetical protein
MVQAMLSRLVILPVFAAILTSADSKLTIERPILSQSEDGVPVPTDSRFAPGDVVFFSCQVAGYTKLPKEDNFVVDLAYTIEVRDSKGLLIIPVETGKVASTLTSEDKKWLPKIRHTIALPPLADTDRFQVTVKVKDNLVNASGEATIPLLVEGREVAASDTLTVRNFRFLRTEEDKDPLQVPAYRPGDTVWARFDMTGYKLGEGNSFDVDYGLKVFRPTGEVTYDQPKAAEEKNQSFYPQRHTPGVLSLTLPADLKRGEYTVLLIVHDNMGSQTYETRQKFAVE